MKCCPRALSKTLINLFVHNAVRTEMVVLCVPVLVFLRCAASCRRLQSAKLIHGHIPYHHSSQQQTQITTSQASTARLENTQQPTYHLTNNPLNTIYQYGYSKWRNIPREFKRKRCPNIEYRSSQGEEELKIEMKFAFILLECHHF